VLVRRYPWTRRYLRRPGCICVDLEVSVLYLCCPGGICVDKEESVLTRIYIRVDKVISMKSELMLGVSHFTH
jgi:hypothetical protein